MGRGRKADGVQRLNRWQERENEKERALREAKNEEDEKNSRECQLHYGADYLKRAKQCVQTNDFEKAIEYCKKAIALDNEEAKDYLPEMYKKLGDKHKDSGNYNKSKEAYNDAVKLNPNYVEAYKNRGDVYADGFKNYQQAIIDYNKAIKIDPDYIDAYYARGRVYKKWSEINFAKAKELENKQSQEL